MRFLQVSGGVVPVSNELFLFAFQIGPFLPPHYSPTIKSHKLLKSYTQMSANLFDKQVYATSPVPVRALNQGDHVEKVLCLRGTGVLLRWRVRPGRKGSSSSRFIRDDYDPWTAKC